MKHDLQTIPNVVDFAYQVIHMDRKLQHLEDENERLRAVEVEYHKLLDSSIAHGRTMIGNTIKMLLVPGVADAFTKNARKQDFPS